MSHSVAGKAELLTHSRHPKLGFWRTYIFSLDHKMIGRQFLFLGFFMLLIGGLLAMMVRWELAWPETTVPGFSWIPEPYMYEGVIPPQTYNALFTMHATIMIFFVVMPIMVGPAWCYCRVSWFLEGLPRRVGQATLPSRPDINSPVSIGDRICGLSVS